MFGILVCIAFRGRVEHGFSFGLGVQDGFR